MKKFKNIAGFLLFSILVLACDKDSASDKEIFQRLALEKPSVIGALATSSPALAKSITEKLSTQSSKTHILEVGAGTGVFTEEIIKNLGSDDVLDIVEVEPELCDLLESKFIGQNPNIRLFCGSILDWNPGYTYQYIISGLPFNSFEADFVESILLHYKNLSSDNGELRFFEYPFLSDVVAILTQRKTRDYVQSFLKDKKAESNLVMLNFPPARIYTMKLFPLKKEANLYLQSAL